MFSSSRLFVKLLAPVFLAGLVFLAPSETSRVAKEAMAGAYINVSVFVALTLAIFYALEHFFKLDTEHLLKKHKNWHIPVSALMGVSPGCGGAIIVMTQFVSGRLGFSSVVAVLTSTMGDAAFLLLAREPSTALLVFAVCFCAGVVSGYVVEAIHGADFLRASRESETQFIEETQPENKMGGVSFLWFIPFVPAIFLAFGSAFQQDTDLWFGSFSYYEPTIWLGVLGAFVCIFFWTFSPNSGPELVNLSGKMTCTIGFAQHRDRVIIDTNFVTIWVVFSIVTFDLLVLWTGIDLKALFDVWRPFMPLIGVLFGFIPGCGPQILVTTFYLNGLIPLSVQIGNAISNDGDALFPAIALAPRAALLATAYTAIPALLVSYGWYFFME